MTAITRTAAAKFWGELPDAEKLYRAAFTHINTLAVQRHLMTGDEFSDVMRDERISKHFAYADDGTMTGAACITNDLHAWPLIAPEYFAHHYPQHYRQQRIWYIGFVCTADEAPVSVFRDLIADMSGPVFDSGGMSVMDFCTYNVNKRRLDVVTDLVLRRLNPHWGEHVLLDTQQFHAWRFDKRRPR